MPARSATRHPPPKRCAGCGRLFEWRRRWARDWDRVRWCSNACRRRGVTDADERAERAILELLDARATDATICPSEAARRLDRIEWRPHLDDVRRAANRLVGRGEIEMTQCQRGLDPETGDHETLGDVP